MQFLKPTLLASAGLLILAACEGGAGNIVSIPSPFTDNPNDGRSAYPNDGRSVYTPGGGSSPTQGGGGTNNGQGGGNQAGTGNQAGSGSGNAQLCALCSQIPTACPALAEAGFTTSVCQAQCGSAPAGCESCVLAAKSCDAITSCLTGICAGGNGQAGTDSGQAGTDSGQAGTDSGQAGTGNTGNTDICGQCANIETCTDGQLPQSSCLAQCNSGVSPECASCVNGAGSNCDTLIACFNKPECQ